MVRNKPLVSIGLPVFNAENYLKKALDSILAQTYGDFEVIISDNASTDNTQQICLEYVNEDNRVSYYRSDRNLGAAWNFNNVFKLSSSMYFKWAAHDDLIAPNFLHECVNLLKHDHSVVLCHSKTARCNEFGQVIGFYDYGSVTDSPKPQTRFRDVLDRKGFPWMIFGVFRTNVLAQTRLLQDYIGSDWNLIAEMSLAGRIVEIPQYLLFRRDHSKSYTGRYHPHMAKVYDYPKATTWWTGKSKKPLVVLPNWRNCLEFFKSVQRSPLNWSERWSCLREIGRWLAFRSGGSYLKEDLSNELLFWRIRINRWRLGNHLTELCF